MRKFLRYADAIALACGTLGMLLQFLILWGGTDHQGLYPAHHPAWILSWVLILGAVVFFWLLSRQSGTNCSFRANFPASPIAAIGCLAAAVTMIIAGIGYLRAGVLLDRLCGLFCLLSGIGMLPAGAGRFFGKRPPFLCYALPCVFFALHVFYLGGKWGGEPEPVRYLFRYFANLAMIPACYQLWGFSVGSGQRQNCLFWNLLAGFLCILSAPGASGSLLYLGAGFWILSNTCALKYIPRRIRSTPQPEAEEELPTVPPEIPSTMEEAPLSSQEEAPLQTPVPEAAADPLTELELDADAIIAEILREIDSNVP